MDFLKKVFDKKNYRYFGAVFVFAGLMLLLFLGTGTKAEKGEKEEDKMAGAYEEYTDSREDDDLTNLIRDYYSYYAAGDAESLETICTPISDSEKSFIGFFSQYVEEYKDLDVKYKDGLSEGAYLVSAEMAIKFAGVDTAAPGLDFFYVETDENDKLFINNLYGSYNKENGEYEMDPEISELIRTFEEQDDMQTLSDSVTEKYNEALKNDPALDSFINQTFQEAAVAWVTQYQGEVLAAEQAAAEQAAAEQAAAEQAAAEQAAAEQAAAEQAAAEQEAAEQAAAAAEGNAVYAKAQINVRSDSKIEAGLLGQIPAGTLITKTGDEGEWSIIDYNGSPAYVKTEYLTTVSSDSSERTVALTDSINIRSGMSEDSSVLRKAGNGESVTILLSFDCGWSKVKYGDTEGFARTDIIK